MISSCGSLGLFKEEAEEVARFVLPWQQHLPTRSAKDFHYCAHGTSENVGNWWRESRCRSKMSESKILRLNQINSQLC